MSLMKRCYWGFLVVLGMVFLACGGLDPAEREKAYQKVKSTDANVEKIMGNSPPTQSHYEQTCRYLKKYGWSHEKMRAAEYRDRHVKNYLSTASGLTALMEAWERDRKRGVYFPPYTLKDFCEDVQREADLVRREATGRTEEDDRQ